MASRRKKAKEKPITVLFIDDTILGNDEEHTSFMKMLEAISIEEEGICVHLIINSSGGDSSKAFAIYDAIERLGLDVETTVQGEAASAAAIVALIGKKRQITRHSSIMIHKAKAVLGSGQAFSHNELSGMGEELEKIGRSIVDIICEKTGLPREQIENDLESGKRYWAEEALEKGFVHEII